MGRTVWCTIRRRSESAATPARKIRAMRVFGRDASMFANGGWCRGREAARAKGALDRGGVPAVCQAVRKVLRNRVSKKYRDRDAGAWKSQRDRKRRETLPTCDQARGAAYTRARASQAMVFCPPREGSSLAMPCRCHGPLLTMASAPSRLVLQYPLRDGAVTTPLEFAVRGFAIESGMFKHSVPEHRISSAASCWYTLSQAHFHEVVQMACAQRGWRREGSREARDTCLSLLDLPRVRAALHVRVLPGLVALASRAWRAAFSSTLSPLWRSLV